MLKGVILDFDGVIIDTERAKFETLKKAARQEGLLLDERSFSTFVGRKRGAFLKREFPSAAGSVRERILSAARKQDSLIVKRAKVIPGLAGLLAFLKRKNVACAIATGSDRTMVEKTLEKHGLPDFFLFIVAGEDFARSKPDPECFRLALRRMGLSASDVIIIEDSAAGITAAKRLGCEVYALTTSCPEKDLAIADRIFEDCRGVLSSLRAFFR